MITVANIRHTKQGEYIGRAMPRQGLKASPLGNPYRLDEGGDRSIPIAQYKRRLLVLIREDTRERREIDRLTEIARTGNLVLLCWCKGPVGSPDIACHGDVIKEIIEGLLEDKNV